MTDGGQAVSRPAAESIRGWTGHRLDEITGGSVGRLEGFFVDVGGGEPEWLVARMGRFGHYTLVPVRDAVEGVGHVWVPYTRDLIRRAPRIDPNAPLPATTERELLDHYGIAVGTARADALGEHDDDAISARPAD